MSEKYSKNVTIALTDKDHAYMSTCASADRRSLAQYLSIMVEREISMRHDVKELQAAENARDTEEGTDG